MVQIDILFQDDHFAVINKPPGLSVLADRTSSLSVWNWLKTHFQDRKIYQVHRLDKETSGVLLVAFTQEAQAQLTKQFSARTIHKTYLALCLGKPQPSSGLIDLPLCPGRKSSFRVAGQRDSIFVDDTSDPPTWKLPTPSQGPQSQRQAHPSQTLYHTAYSNEQYSLLVIHPLTGRTHQIRVHLAWIGHQLLGDPLYGKPQASRQQAERLALHSFSIEFIENWVPGCDPRLRSFQAPLPAFFEDTLEKMAQSHGDNARAWRQNIDSTLAKLTPTAKTISHAYHPPNNCETS